MKYIYGLVDPRTRGVRYIGQTDNLTRRLREHIQEKENTAKGEWIRALRDQGLAPTIMQLATVSDFENAFDVENRWIYFGRKAGWELTNTAGMRSEEYYSLQGYFERLIVEMEKPEGVNGREYSMADIKQGLTKNLVLSIESLPSVFRHVGALMRTELPSSIIGFLSVVTYWLMISPGITSGPVTFARVVLAIIAFFGGLAALGIIVSGLFGDEERGDKAPQSLVWTIGVTFVGLSVLAYLFG